MEVILIRHGEPRYDETTKDDFMRLAGNFGRLTKAGEKQALKRAKDPILKGASLIVSSPYTRALQTAATISRITNIPLTVEHGLHEWEHDTSHELESEDPDTYKTYIANRGVLPKGSKFRYEEYEHLKKRVLKAIKKYKNHDKIIVVCHGIVISTLTHFDDLIEFCGVRVVHLDF
jgi:broad specificity phosphatase PhoE